MVRAEAIRQILRRGEFEWFVMCGSGVGEFEGWFGGDCATVAVIIVASISITGAAILTAAAAPILSGSAKIKHFIVQIVKGALVKGRGRCRGGRALIGRWR